LLGPEGGLDAKDARGFGGGEVAGEVVVVDALPGFVRGAPVLFSLINGMCWMGRGKMRWDEMKEKEGKGRRRREKVEG
jgi:hypothetical protein